MSPTSPCLDCKYRDADKNRKGCVNCEKRLAYVRALGAECCGLPSAVIDGPTLEDAKNYQDSAPRATDIAPTVRDIIIDACRACGAEYREVTGGRGGRNLPGAVIEARRQAVRRLLVAGVRAEQVADAMALSRSTVYRYAPPARLYAAGQAASSRQAVEMLMADTCEAHGIARDLLTHRTARGVKVQAARRQVVAALRNPPFAMRPEQICRAMGMSLPTVRRYVAMAEGSPRPAATAKRDPAEVVADVCRAQGIAPADLGAPKAKRARILVTARLRGEPYRMSLAEVGKIFGMGFKAAAAYTAIAKEEGLLPPGQCYALQRRSRKRKAA